MTETSTQANLCRDCLLICINRITFIMTADDGNMDLKIEMQITINGVRFLDSIGHR